MSPALAEKLANLPDRPGCYLYKDAEARVIYVGKAKNLRKRVASYFQDKAGHPSRTLRLVAEVIDLELIETDSEVEALLVENSLIKDLQPRFNVKLKDDKSFPLIAISREQFPKVFCTRDAATANVDLIGPFTSATELYRAFHFLQRVFRFRVCDLDIREGDPVRRHFTPCLNWHIKRCSAPCTLRIGKSDYLDDVRALRAFLSGRGKAEVVAALTARMKAHAATLHFEEAARCRDQLTALERLKQRGNLKDYDEPDAPVIDLHSGMLSLQQHLGLAAPPKVIEGFDIAHLMGTHVVAAQVQFVSGVPNKDGYRRFKVQGEDGNPGNDDFAAMREVVGRRYRRLRDEGAALPDVVMIDGGHGQVKMAMDALREVGVVLPCVVGLAKAEETIIRPSGEELRLSRRDPGLKLLQYVRDEAHRFCRRYLHLLKAKEIKPASPASKRKKSVRRDTPAATPPSTGGTEH
jgi:excinuclease ABC subunit C